MNLPASLNVEESVRPPLVSERMRAFLAENPQLETPFLLVDLAVIERQYNILREVLPSVDCYYAVKSNSAMPVIERLHRLGSGFEVASIYEVHKCLSLGVRPEHIHFGNTIKKESHIAESYRLGVRSFAFDAMAELEKLARAAPGALVSCRLATDGFGAVWGLCRKFGREPDDVVDLMIRARDLGLKPYGLSFHVGSQQRDPAAWRRAIARAAEVGKRLRAQGIELGLINIGGGFPSFDYLSQKLKPQAEIEEYGRVIQAAVQEYFPQGIRCMMEPGRFISAGAGMIKSEVVLVTEKWTDGALRRWIYLDVGRFNGLYEAADVVFPVFTSRDGEPRSPAIVAGPTCDSDDVLYDRERALELPNGLRVGDSILFANVGAYSLSYRTLDFNGFPPLQEYYI